MASNVGDTLSDAHNRDILLVANDCIATGGALLVGFSTTGSAAIPSLMRLDSTTIRMSGNTFMSGFSNISGVTYTSTLSNSGAAYIGGPLVASSNVSFQGFSNIGGSTFCSNLSSSGSVNFLGPVSYSGDILGNGLSNVGGVTYVASLNTVSSSQSNLYGNGFSNVGRYCYVSALSNIGNSCVGCNIQVAGTSSLTGTVSVGGAVLGNGFSNVGGATYVSTLSNNGNSSTLGTVSLQGPLLAVGFSNVSGVTYAANIVGAALTGCSIPYSSVTGSPAGTWSNSGSNTFVVGSNVGIGLSNPLYVLDVCGVSRFSSNLLCPGLSNINGVTYVSSVIGGSATFGGIYASSFSNVAGAVYASNIVGASLTGCVVPYSSLTGAPFSTSVWNVSGTSAYIKGYNTGIGTSTPAFPLDVLGTANFSGPIVSPGFSNVNSTTFVSSLIAGTASLSGRLDASNGLYASAFSNVSSVTYASNIVGATLTGCVIPYASVQGSPWTVTGSNVCVGMNSNIGVGVTAPAYALDVNGDMRTSGTVYANAFALGGSASSMTAPVAMTQASGMRNRVINGDMRFDQRFSGANQVVTNISGSYIADRMIVDAVGASGSVNAQTVAGGPCPGLNYSLQVSVASTNPGPAGPNDFVSVSQRIEGVHLNDLAWGTPLAYAVTVSFWIRSSVTGTFAISVRNDTVTPPGTVASRSNVAPFTINTANSWTRVFVSLDGDQTGTWQQGALLGAVVGITLTSGVSVSTSGTGWQGGVFCGVSGQTNFMSAVGNQVNITGFQFERGSSVTAFENRPYSTELQLCRRYFHMITGTWESILAVGKSGYQGTFCVNLPAPQRVLPSVAITSTSGLLCIYIFGGGIDYTVSNPVVTTNTVSTQNLTLQTSWVTTSGSPVLSAGMAVNILMQPGGWLSFTAEL